MHFGRCERHPSLKVRAAVAAARMFLTKRAGSDAAIATIDSATRGSYTSDGYAWSEDKEKLSSFATYLAWQSRNPDIEDAARRLVAAGPRQQRLHP